MIKEFEFLKIINDALSKNAYLGDDCAYLKELNLCLSADAFVEDVHFSLDFMTPYEIGRKALLVNISDILASGAKPKYALITLSGKLNNDFIKNFYKGINEVANIYDVEIIGGDLTSADKISISIAIIGDTTKRNISSRKNAKPGYIVATAGEFGSSYQGLVELKQGLKDSYFINYHKNPPLNRFVSDEIAFKTKNSYAMMDSSDGLIDCIYQISSKSNVKININYDLISKKTENRDYVLFGGEDYALVIALSPDDFKNISSLTKIGICAEGEGIYLDNKKIEYRGYEHFE